MTEQKVENPIPKPILPKKRTGVIIPKKYNLISDELLAKKIIESVKFAIPTGGVHKPMTYRNKDGWGLVYKILANVDARKLAKKSNKYDICSFTWKHRKGLLVPAKGYEGLLKTIDILETQDFKQIAFSDLIKSTH